MGRFNLFISNRMERLAAQLADTLRRPLSDPLWGDIIIVQNRGMERWISMQLALRHGICANVRFPFPRVFLHEIATSLTGISPAGDYEPEILTWWSRIFELPCVAIGGITPANAPPLIAAGADFVAVCGAVWNGDEAKAVGDFTAMFAKSAE